MALANGSLCQVRATRSISLGGRGLALAVGWLDQKQALALRLLDVACALMSRPMPTHLNQSRGIVCANF